MTVLIISHLCYNNTIICYVLAVGAAAVAQHFGWKRLAVIYTTDTFGTDSYNLFKIWATDYDIQIVSSFSVPPGITADGNSKVSLIASLNRMKSLDALIFVFLIDDIVAAKDVWLTAFEMGVITSQTPTIGTHDITSPEIWKESTEAEANRWKGIMSGL